VIFDAAHAETAACALARHASPVPAPIVGLLVLELERLRGQIDAQRSQIAQMRALLIEQAAQLGKRNPREMAA
jgi:hypothetical protein